MNKNFQLSIFNFQFRRGFTFIETLVVISVLGLVFPVVFTTLFVILQQQVKLFRLTEVKRQGDHIVNIAENIVKDNAYKIYNNTGTEICDAKLTNPTGNVASFEDEYGSDFSLLPTGFNLTVSSNVTAPAPTFAFPPGQLNNSKVIIQTFSMTCNRASVFSAPLITLNFTVCYKTSVGTCASTRPEETASLDYQTYIKLRTFPTQ